MPVPIAKLIWTCVQPLSLAIILIALAFLLLAFKRRRFAGFVLLLDGAMMFVASFTSLGYLLIAPLEDRFPRPAAPPTNVAAIIVLGGGIDGEVSHARQLTELTAGGDRFVEGLRLALLYPDAKLVISGGFGSLVAEGESDAAAAERFYTGLGIAPERLVLEGQSRSTAENAALTRDLIDQSSGGTLLLVTSAFHMPRSVAFFRAAGLEVTAWPTDYRSAGDEPFRFDPTNPPENLLTMTTGIREWIALLIYSSTGQIDSIYPEP
jgi:uncharacterized SAM-binding protein YcdF (DUF218 family)